MGQLWGDKIVAQRGYGQLIMPRLRFAILCAIGGFILIAGFLLLNSRFFTGLKLGALRNMLPANVDMRLSNLILNEAGENGRRLALNATSAHYFKVEDYFLLNDITAKIDSPEQNLLVTAEAGRYDPKKKAVILTGKVRAVDNQGRVLTSSRVELDMTQGALTSLGEFCLEDPDLSLSGQGFVYNTKTGVLNVDGRILFMINSL
ncbi:MAG: LPS export ABC transporter periplasmic protein LptC [Deltaproteobacteria bacterium]|jgi:LPS export ABC transporter protein LptC|nr:LPS export ABC transporter periplasmic protein LptC [Deltaproteobacteria bacterium]